MPYHILSLDGGGSWALIQARVLRDIYGNIRGHELLRKFDMAIANSGGSLVLACLCNNMSLDEIVGVFENEKLRKKVFSSLSTKEKISQNFISLFRNMLKIGPKYHTDRKRSGLLEVLASFDPQFKQYDGKPLVSLPMRELPALIGREIDLLIVGFDYFRERASFFRSNAGSNTDRFALNSDGSRRFYDVSLLDAIHASSNAPLNYFDRPAKVITQLLGSKEKAREQWYWDGAVSGFNNPVLAGLVEALTNGRGRTADDYRILSLGTGLTRKAVITDYEHSGNPKEEEIWNKNKKNEWVVAERESQFLQDVPKMASSILSDPPDSATFIAYSILEPSLKAGAPIVRINPCLSPELSSDNFYRPMQAYKNSDKKFSAIMELDMDAVENEEVDLIKDLCSRFITPAAGNTPIPNQFIRGDAGNGLGYGTYQEAKAAWMRFSK